MRYARAGFDVGLFSNIRDAQLEFWQQRVGLAFDHLGKLGGGIQQHRHVLGDAILKMNHARDPLPQIPAGGFTALQVFGEVDAPEVLADPDGNRVELRARDAAVGGRYGLCIASPDPERLVRFYAETLGLTQCALPADGPRAEACLAHGEGRIFVTAAAPGWAESPDWRGPGFRYLTVQVMSARDAWAEALAAGARVGEALRDLGELVRFGFIRDPDGNWIELSERTTFTGRPLG